MPEASLAYIETPFLSVTCVVADTVVKAGDVRILGFEPTGAETIVIRLAAADISGLHAALEAAKETATALGVNAVTATIARPEDAQFHLNDHPNSINPLYGGRDELRPTDFPENRTMNNQAIGILETQGLTAILQATDAMLKAANVELVGKEKIGAAYVTIIIRGDVAAVKAAIEAGSQAVGDLGKLIAAHVIARPHEGLLRLLP
jgi:carbon dioxide concentrating mechanism protein CcmO